MIFRIIAAFVIVVAGISVSSGQTSGYTVEEGKSYKNLTIFLIRGKDTARNPKLLTLQEAMARDLFAVYETSSVNTLEVENLSKEFDVFIQSGDIVKGGKQDRVLAVSIIVPAGSGRISIQAFCVESGRWEKREAESSDKFSSSNERIVSKELKVAANVSRSQGEVWDEVTNVQSKLSANVTTDVRSSKSKTSLQLSLENKAVREAIDEYVKNLSGAIDGKSDVIGYAFAINGVINSADIYASHDLFVKLWPRMLRAAATEAVAEYNARLAYRPVKAPSVSAFLADAEKAKAEERVAAKGVKIIIRDGKENVVYEAVDDKSKAVIHRNYVKRN
jgi:flagellar basal body-associated protein FliL